MNRPSAARPPAALDAAFLLLAACVPAMAGAAAKAFCLLRPIMLSTLVESGRQHRAGQGATPKGDLFEI